MNGRAWLAATLVIASLAPAVARAGGFHTTDFGARRNGMLAVVGRPDDVTAIYHNPAGLTLLQGTQVYLTAEYTQASLGFRFYDSEGKLKPDRELTPDQNWAIVPFLGVASDLGTKDLRVGLALYAPNLYGASLPESAPSRYHLTRGFFFATHLTGTLAYRVNPKFSIGASISAVYMIMQGTQYMNPLVVMNPDLRFDTPDNVRQRDLKVSLDGRGWTWDWNVGVLIHPIPSLGIGLSFTSGADVSLKGDVKIRPVGSGAVTQTIGQTTKMKIPFTLRMGVNWEFVKDFQVGVDFSYWHYQVFQEQVMELERPIEGIPGTTQRTPKSFGNAWNLSGGFLYRVIPELDLMIGVQRDTSPIPTRTMTVDNLNRGLTSLATGVRWRATNWMQVGVTYMRSWADLLEIQDSVTSPPTNGKGHGGMNHVSAELMFRL